MKSLISEFSEYLALESELQNLKHATGVYLIYCTVTGKGYVGSVWQSGGFNTRWIVHISTANRGKHDNSHFQRAWNKYGKSNFEFLIVEVCIGEELCLKREQSYIDMLWDTKMLFNISKITSGGCGPHTPEAREKMSKSHILRWSDPDVRENGRIAALKVWESPGARHKQSVAMLKRYSNPEEVAKAVASHTLRCADPAVRKQMSMTQLKRLEDAEIRAKQSKQASAASQVRWDKPESKVKQSEIGKRSTAIRWADSKQREALSLQNKLQWADPVKRKSRLEAIAISKAKRKALKEQNS